MQTIQLLGTVMGLGFVAGINLYATVLAVGLGINLGLIRLAPDLAGLAALGHPLVIGVAALMYTMEFFADKIPWVDSMWDALHTFIRPLGAAWIGATALGEVDPALEVAAFLLAGGVAFTTHATKSGVRLIANGSPEPFSNVVLSLTEDAFAFGGAWLTMRYPTAAGLTVVAFLIAFVLVAPRLFRVLRAHAAAMLALVRSWLGRARQGDDHFEPLPDAYAAALPPGFGRSGDLVVRCLAGRGVTGARRGQLGYLCLARDGGLFWLGRRGFRVRRHPINLAEAHGVEVTRGLLFDDLFLRSGARTVRFRFTRDRRRALEALARRLQAGREAATPTAA
jgi:hypothetical protein